MGGPFSYQLRSLAQELASRRRRHVPPDVESMLDAFQSRIEIGERRLGHPANFLRGGGFEYRQCVAGRRVRPATGDEELGIGVTAGANLPLARDRE